jgi:hypothetical protein
MGGSSSKSTSATSKVVNDKVVVSQSDVEVLDKYITDIISNNVVESAKQCSTTTFAEQKIDISNVTVKGDIDINASQEQDIAISFDCVQASVVRNSTSIDLINKIMEQLSQNNNTSITDTLNNIAQSKLETSTIADLAKAVVPKIGDSDTETSTSNTEIINKTNINVSNRTAINHVVQSAVINNFTTKDVQDFISKVSLSQSIKLSNLISTDGSAHLGIGQKQASLIILKAIQDSKIGNNIVTSIMNGLELKSDTTTTTTSQTTASATATSEKASNILPTGTSGSSSSNVLIWLLVIGGIVAVIVFIWWMKSQSSDDNENSNDE